jgi:hypothetical protein
MSDALKTVLTFICGAGGLALIEWARERWKFKAERKAQKEDRAEEKVDKIGELTKAVKDLQTDFDEQGQQLDALRGAMKCVLLDRIIHLGQKYIDEGEVDFDDRKRLRDMHTSYHQGLKGNGDADAIMKAVDALPLKNSK